MRIHNFEWFKNNCIFKADGYYYKNELGCMPLVGINLCGKKVIKVGKRYNVPEGVKIKDDVVREFTYIPLCFFEKEGMEIE